MSGHLRALFVDDDPAVLGGLKRMLRAIRNEIESDFVDNGPDALTRMESDGYDVVVTDIRMPGMSGIEVLEAVSADHPDMARLVLSGYSDRADTLRAAGLAHQYLA